MKLVALSGSPRKGGNTDILLEKALETAREREISVQKIVLNDLSIRPCQECGGCLKTGSCVIQDDMAVVYNAIDAADIIIVASPIFFGNVSAQTKIMIDRMQCRWANKYVLKRESPKRSRRGAFISCGAIKTDKYFKCAKTVVGIFFHVQDIEYKEDVFVQGVDAKEEILKYQDALGSVSKMTERLIS